MNDQFLPTLQYAAGVPRALRLGIRAPDGTESEQEFNLPYVLIGRSPDCQIVLPEQTISYRHVYLQPIGNRLAVVDLLSVAGVKWKPASPEFCGWYSPELTMQVGGYEFRLLDDAWEVDEQLPPPLDFRPKDSFRQEYGLLPQVKLELLNTSAKGKVWPINRVITMIGRDDRCRVTVVDDRLSRVQCALLLLPSGLWVIDMLGKGGVSVNGELVKCAPLAHGSEFEVGPYKLAALYPQYENVEPPRLTGESDFITRQNKIFRAEVLNDTLFVTPMGDALAFLYKDIHVEASRINEVIRTRQIQHVIVDFSEVQSIANTILEPLANFCRNSRGKSALCGANAETYSIVQRAPVHRLGQHYSTRNEAFQAVYLP